MNPCEHKTQKCIYELKKNRVDTDSKWAMYVTHASQNKIVQSVILGPNLKELVILWRNNSAQGKSDLEATYDLRVRVSHLQMKEKYTWEWFHLTSPGLSSIILTSINLKFCQIPQLSLFAYFIHLPVDSK